MIEPWNRLRDFLHRGRLARELDEELRFHQRQLEHDQRAAGLNEADAEHAARRRLGNRTFISEEARAMWSFAWLEDLVHDLRYGLRSLRRSPAFAGVAVLTLALGIGANTAIFTVMNGVLFRALPYGEPGRLVMLWETTKDLPQILVSYPNYLDWRGRVQSFEDVALYNGFGSFNLTRMGDAERVKGGLASGNLFDVLRVRPALGRGFRMTDDAVGAERVAILSDAFWKRRFAADSGVIGKRLALDGFSYTIVGVLPPRIRLAGAEIWVPIGLFANTEQFRPRDNHPGTIGLGRLKAGVTLELMHADLDAVYRQLRSEYPRENAGISASGGWLLDQVLGGIRPALYVLAGAVGLVLLIACANVANLLLGRASSRQREIALRVAMGARGGRIIRQLLTESVLLSLVGGALGTALAWGGVRVLLALRPSNIPRVAEIGLDATALAFALGISVLTGIVFGIVPALQSASGDLLASLKDGGRGASAGRNRLKLRSTLMVAEVALALVLLVGAGLLLRSFEKLTNVDPGVDPRNVTAGLVSLPERKYPEPARRRALFTELLARAKAIPRVTDAALASDLPVSSSWQTGVTFEGLPLVAPGSEPLLNAAIVSPDWFATMRMRIVAGRGIEPADVPDGPAVVVISANVARRFYSDGNPVGRRLKMGKAASSSPWITVVGVVSDVQDSGPSIEPRGTMYFPIAQNTPDALWLAVRAGTPGAPVVPMMREALAAIDKEVPLASVATLEERLDDSVAQPKFSMLMLGIFAAIALVLAAVGIYGVISYSVAQRTHEIGLRIALGARRLDVLMMVVRQVLVITAIGIVIGGAGALATGSLLTNLLFGVRASDPVTFASVSIGLALVALVAAAVPAWRAARLDPVGALRGE